MRNRNKYSKKKIFWNKGKSEPTNEKDIVNGGMGKYRINNQHSGISS